MILRGKFWTMLIAECKKINILRKENNSLKSSTFFSERIIAKWKGRKPWCQVKCWVCIIVFQKKNTWINPSFDDFGGDFRRISGSTVSQSGTSTQTLVSRKRTRNAEDPINQSGRVKPSSPTSDLWVEKYKPESAVIRFLNPCKWLDGYVPLS